MTKKIIRNREGIDDVIRSNRVKLLQATQYIFFNSLGLRTQEQLINGEWGLLRVRKSCKPRLAVLTER